MPISSGQYSRSSDASASTVGDRVVLYHRVSRAAVVLNPTGSWMWDRLAAPQNATSLVRDLRERFPSVSAEDAERDVVAFLTDLVHHAMVVVQP